SRTRAGARRRSDQPGLSGGGAAPPDGVAVRTGDAGAGRRASPDTGEGLMEDERQLPASALTNPSPVPPPTSLAPPPLPETAPLVPPRRRVIDRLDGSRLGNKVHLAAALLRAGASITKAAKDLGISRHSAAAVARRMTREP